MAREWTLHLPWKSPPLSLNQRMHWAVKARLTKQVRLVGFAKARASKIPDLEKCSVELVWFVNTKHRRDTINPMLTLKALVDGLVDAEVIPDDSHEYVQTQVRIEYVPKSVRQAGLVLVVRERRASQG